MSAPSLDLTEYVADQAIRTMQSHVVRCARQNHDLRLGEVVDGQMIALISRESKNALVKIDLILRDGIFCRITDVPAMLEYMERNGVSKAWDDDKSHTSIVKNPQNAIGQLERRINSAIKAHRNNRNKFDRRRQ